MAVQIPDPGTGNGQTGDNEYVFRKKVKDNFSDQNNAASRLVGEKSSNLMEVGAFGLGGKGDSRQEETTEGLISALKLRGSCFFRTEKQTPITSIYGASLFLRAQSSFASISISRSTPSVKVVAGFDGANNVIYDLWNTGNTTKDSNGFLKAASPIVKVFADKVELNADAIDQNVTYKKNGIGDYTITTQSGLSTDGWYIELPKDMNGNPKVAVTLEETDGVISLKSYKRIFSMETFTFVPDLNEPLDIPDNRWIDLRLNEIPVEPSEPRSEV